MHLKNLGLQGVANKGPNLHPFRHSSHIDLCWIIEVQYVIQACLVCKAGPFASAWKLDYGPNLIMTSSTF